MSDKELITKETKSGWDVCVAAVLASALMILPEASFAGLSTGGNIEGVLCIIIGLFTGTLGKALATLAIIIIGVGALMGKVSWGMAIIVALGIAIIFGASEIVDILAGNESADQCDVDVKVTSIAAP